MPPLVLLHAIGLDSLQWQFCNGLSDVLAIDLPGHGQQVGECVESLESVADWVAATIPAGCDVVGLSMGGMVAQHLAIRHPGYVRSFVLICTKPSTDSQEMLKRGLAIENSGIDSVVDSTLQRWFTPQALVQRDHPGVSYVRNRMLADSPATVASYWRAMSYHDVRESLRQVREPVTIVMGRQDGSFSTESAEVFRKLISGSRLDIRDGPHLLCLEEPDETVGAIRSHLDWIESLEMHNEGN